MWFIGTLLNLLTVLAGGLIGLVLGDRLPERLRENVVAGVGLFVLAMGVKFAIDTASLLYLLGAVVIGGVIGPLWGIERRLNAFGESIQRRVAAPAVGEDRDQVAHRAGGDVAGGLLAQHLGGALLEPLDGGVLAVLVVADLGLGHRRAHRRRRPGEGVAAELEDLHFGTPPPIDVAAATSSGATTIAGT